MKHWLAKSEPGAYSIDDLERDGTTFWDGIRNYEARNSMQAMKVGDQILFYHSNAKPPGVVGIMEVVKTAYPDHTAFDPKDGHYDVKSDPENPRWFMVDVGFVEKLPRIVGLPEIRDEKTLQVMDLVSRFRAPSVQPVTKRQFDKIVAMASR